MQKRLIIPSLLMMFSTSLQALTLGQIHVHSYISQPLKATIDIKDADKEELAEFVVKLASRTAFKNAGVDWSEKLEGLRFSLIQRNTGPAIRVTGRKAELEPFLSFVVDVHWKNGKLVKDYTLLLDPPLYSGKAAAPVEMTAVISVPAAPQPAVKPQQPEAAAAPQAGADKTVLGSSKGAENAAQTMTGSSLWQVASKVRPADATMQQTMVAIHEENPEAFMRGNINLLKKGQLLRIPSADVIQGIPAKAAVNRVARHNKALRAGRSISSSQRLSPEIITLVKAPSKPPVSQPAAQTETPDQGGRLTLDSAADAGSDVLAEAEPLSGGPALIADTAAQDENKKLRSRVKLLEEQLKVAHKLIKMKGELAQLQQLYRQLDEQKAQAVSDQLASTEPDDAELLQLTDEGTDSSSTTAAKQSDQELLNLTDARIQEAEVTAAQSGEPQAPAAPLSEEDQSGSKTPEGDQQVAGADADPQSAADIETPTNDAEAQSTAGASSTEAEMQEMGDVATAEEPLETATDEAVTNEQAADEDAAAILDDAADAASEPVTAAASSTAAVVEQQASDNPDGTVTPEQDSGSAATPAQSEEKAVADVSPSANALIAGIDNKVLMGAGGVLALLLTFLIGRRKSGAGRDSDNSEGELVGEREEDPGTASEHQDAAARAQTAADDDDPVSSQQQGETMPPASGPTDALDAPAEVDSAEHADLHTPGLESLGVVNRTHAKAEVIELDSGLPVDGGDAGDDEQVSGQDEGSSGDPSDSELEEALLAFEKEMLKKQSGEALAESQLALDETAEILDDSVSSVVPDAQRVDDLELEEELVLDESSGSDLGVEAITLDDSFGIDSHINSDFDDVFAGATGQEVQQNGSLEEMQDKIPEEKQDEKQDDAHPAFEPLDQPGIESEDHSVTSFNKEPSDLKHAEIDAKIDLAAAFADMGDLDGARDILDEVLADGTAQQQQAAQQLLKKYL